jgi:hypothetical protein
MSIPNFGPVENAPRPGAKKADTMCSNCSGDDLKPESFSLFDVSSPTGSDRFAGASSEKRKRYRTGWFSAKFAKAALTQAIQSVRRSTCDAGIIGNIDRGSFVNLNLGSSAGEYMAKSRNSRDAGNPVEIRVSSDAIIEVFANCDSEKNMRSSRRLSERKYLSPWEESYAERKNLQRTLGGFHRMRRLKYFVAYGALVTVAALAVWCVVR